MNTRVAVYTFIAVLSLFIGCSSISVTSDYDPATDFSKLKTYQWLHAKEAGDDALAKNPLIGKRVEEGVKKALEAKGYTLDEIGTPDFYVAAHAGAKDKINVTDYGYAYGGYWGRYGGYGRNVDVSYYTEATLFIDIAQKVGDKIELIWRGAGTGTVEDRPMEERQQRIDDATMKILAEFPPGKK
jgi:hypothetical protein